MRSPPQQVAAVVVTFNRLAQLQTTVQRSFAAGVASLVVVNNASTDGTRDWLDAQADPRLVVLHLPVNVGGAGGFHYGFDHVVRQLDADWLVCYDDDAYPEQSCLEVFRQMEIPQDVAGVAAAVYLPDGCISEMNRPSRDPFASLGSLLRTAVQRRSGFHVSDDDYAKTGLVPIDFSSFVGCFLRTDAIRQHLGLPRKELFIYADDIMYTHGIGRSGLQHCFAPELRFVHDCGTLHMQMDVYKPIWKVYYTYRNRLELFRQVAGPLFFYPIALLKLISWQRKARFYDERATYLRLMWRAWRDGMRRDFSIQHSDVIKLSQSA
jgi:rhamnopyranosyl-N-acetylglucosaminyl-diphospho-decaprenol beta-1,3/1,4-galactofuranosyltransferase